MNKALPIAVMLSKNLRIADGSALVGVFDLGVVRRLAGQCLAHPVGIVDVSQLVRGCTPLVAVRATRGNAATSPHAEEIRYR